ncbi:MAG: YwqG family protein [Clostridiales bacterium]|nr:YwqG family protein [Clostridiales bacterium]
MDYKALFQGLSRNSIRLGFDVESDTPVPAGASKFGGEPDLPEGFEWPYFKDAVIVEYKQAKTAKSLFSKGGGRLEEVKSDPMDIPLSFLLQINCEEIAQYDTERLLPGSGMLYFFYELRTMRWGFDPEDKGCARVYYSDAKGLARQPFPPGLEPDCRLPEIPVSFSAENDLPDWEEFAENNDEEGYDSEEYYEERELLGYVEDEESERSKLLGYSDIIQNDMHLECEMSANRIYSGAAYSFRDLSEGQRAELNEKSKQWRLLLQLGTVQKEGFELMFGDCGRIYYWIREGDLARRDFDGCWLVLQCY